MPRSSTDSGRDAARVRSPRPARRAVQAVLLGAATALAGLVASLLPAGAALEESLGLKVLFALRGARPAPAEVLLVGIDKRSAEALGLPRDPARWPRSLHARLTETLARAGARVIAFDLFFEQERGPDDDRRFARAIERAGNVVLARFLTWDTAPLAAPGGPGGHLSVEHLVPPVRLLAEAAAGTAPFPLPKVPVRVNRYWTFKPGAGDAPTLPAVAFQLFALDAYDDLVAHLLRLAPEQARALPRDRRAFVAAGPAEVTVGRIRELFDGAPHLAARLLAQLEAPGAGDDPVRAARLRALVRLYAGPDSPYLDYYGPPGSIRTLPYHEVLALEGEPAGSPRLAPLAGAAVFVGMSEYLRPTQKDGFYTVYSDDEGRDISGVEIAATAFANLLEARPLEPLPPLAHAAVVLAGGAALGVGCRLLPPLWAAAWALAAALAYLAGAQQAFARAGSWWPLVVPLLLQTPLALAAGVAWRYAEVSRERWRIRRLLAYHVPEAVIEELPADFPRGATDGRLAYGVCLATDAERYTGLAESLEPAELAGLMNRYYAALFEPIRRHGGIVSDVVGDAALAIWAGAAPDPTLRARACRAACEVARAAERFGGGPGGRPLPTRIGLHAGPILLGHVGALDHYEYRAVGDTVNSATRIQGLNKRLGTRILASGEAVQGLDGFLLRRLGRFLLPGKSHPIELYELMGPDEAATETVRRMAALFAEGLAAYEAGAFAEARAAFAALLRECGEDRPARFYLERCAAYAERPPEGAPATPLVIDAR